MQEFEPQISYAFSSATEASSPYDPKFDTMLYYSAPTSPIPRTGSATFGYEHDPNDEINLDDDFFEFVTFHDFCSGSEFEESKKFDDKHDEDKDESMNSLSKIAFADELFCNGQVKPLKLPPRLQNGYATSSPSPAVSPTKRSLAARRNMWNDDFDPFKVALEKVTEEHRGRKSVHRRARSHSPFRVTATDCPIESAHLQDDSIKQPETIGPIENGLAKPKGLAYSRWARHGSMGHKRSSSLVGSSPKRPTRFKGLSFMKKVRPLKMGQEEPAKPTVKEGKNSEKSEANSSGETKKMEKVKGILKRYASIGKQKSEKKLEAQVSTVEKPNYFKNLSLKFKGKSNVSGKKNGFGESRSIVVPYRPNKLTLCLGNGGESPRV